MLQQLAVTVIEAVTKFDQFHDVGRYLTSLTVVCTGPGEFELQIVDKNCTEDLDALVEAVAAELDIRNHLEYYKPLRQIDVGSDTKEQSDGGKTTRPPSDTVQ